MKKLVLNVVVSLLLLSCMAVQQTTQAATPVQESGQIISSTCPPINTSEGNWERYKPNSMEGLVTSVSQISHSSPETNPSYYVETGADYLFPSCVKLEYKGKYREFVEPRKRFYTIWSSIFQENQPQIAEGLKHEALFTENGKEYWISVYEPLVPYMENELEPNEPAIVFLVWAGTVFLDEKADHVFLIGEFSKEE